MTGRSRRQPRILAACDPGEIRIAVVADRLVAYAIWRPGRPDGVGDVHAGRVSAVTPELGGCFVTLAGGEGFLPDTACPAKPAEGDAIAVRIARAAQGSKGPRLTARVDQALIAAAQTGGVRLLARGPGALERLAGEFLDAAMLIDDAAVMAALPRELRPRARLVARAFDGAVEDEIAVLESPVAPLPGGGRMIVQPTSALVAIDVDSGSGLGGGGKSAAHAAFNAGAVPEIARQIRLRNLGGAIMIDFAGLAPRRRAALAAPLQAALARDPVPCRLVGFTGLGLAELVRQRVHPPLHEMLSGPHAAAAAALRAARQRWRLGAALRVRAALDVIAALQADDVMQAGLAQGELRDLIVQPDPALRAGVWQLDEL